MSSLCARASFIFTFLHLSHQYYIVECYFLRTLKPAKPKHLTNMLQTQTHLALRRGRYCAIEINSDMTYGPWVCIFSGTVSSIHRSRKTVVIILAVVLNHWWCVSMYCFCFLQMLKALTHLDLTVTTNFNQTICVRLKFKTFLCPPIWCVTHPFSNYSLVHWSTRKLTATKQASNRTNCKMSSLCAFVVLCYYSSIFKRHYLFTLLR